MQYRQAVAQGADFSNSDNHVDVVDPKRHEAIAAQRKAAREATRRERAQKRYELAAKKPPKHVSTDEANRRNVGFVVMDYRL